MSSVAGVPIFKGKSYNAKRISADNVNSWDQTLTAVATLTGAAEEVMLYQCVSVSMKTDQPGTVYFEQSTDGTNWDISVAYDIVSDASFDRIRVITHKLYRTRFVSSAGSDHTYLRLQTSYGNFGVDTKGFTDNDVLFDPDDSRPLYIGKNTLIGAATSGGEWEIHKFTYDGTTYNVTQVQTRKGVWDDRAGLF